MKIAAISIVVCALLLFVLPAIGVFSIREISYERNVDIVRLEKLSGEKVFKQEIVSRGGAISSIGINFRNYNQINKKGLIFKMSTSEGAVREMLTNGVVVKDGAMTRFKFVPLIADKGTLLSVSILSPDSIDEEALEVGFGKNDIFVNQVFYRPAGYLSLIKTVYSDWSKSYFADRWFAAVYSMITVSLFLYILWPKKQNI